jgi:hypothetical protein
MAAQTEAEKRKPYQHQPDELKQESGRASDFY